MEGKMLDILERKETLLPATPMPHTMRCPACETIFRFHTTHLRSHQTWKVIYGDFPDSIAPLPRDARKIIAVLEEYITNLQGCSESLIASTLGISKTSLRRVLWKMQAQGYLMYYYDHEQDCVIFLLPQPVSDEKGKGTT